MPPGDDDISRGESQSKHLRLLLGIISGYAGIEPVLHELPSVEAEPCSLIGLEFNKGDDFGGRGFDDAGVGSLIVFAFLRDGIGEGVHGGDWKLVAVPVTMALGSSSGLFHRVCPQTLQEVFLPLSEIRADGLLMGLVAESGLIPCDVCGAILSTPEAFAEPCSQFLGPALDGDDRGESLQTYGTKGAAGPRPLCLPCPFRALALGCRLLALAFLGLILLQKPVLPQLLLQAVQFNGGLARVCILDAFLQGLGVIREHRDVLPCPRNPHVKAFPADSGEGL